MGTGIAGSKPDKCEELRRSLSKASPSGGTARFDSRLAARFSNVNDPTHGPEIVPDLGTVLLLDEAPDGASETLWFPQGPGGPRVGDEPFISGIGDGCEATSGRASIGGWHAPRTLLESSLGGGDCLRSGKWGMSVAPVML